MFSCCRSSSVADTEEGQKKTQNTPILEFRTYSTDSGHWVVPKTSKFLFGWSSTEKVQKALDSALLDASRISSKIEKAVEEITGEPVANGTYLNNPVLTRDAMNKVEGMGSTEFHNIQQHGEGSTLHMTKEFFKSVFADVDGDITPISEYLRKELASVRAEVGGVTNPKSCGVIIGLVSLFPGTTVPSTTFKYVYALEKTTTWFTKISCDEGGNVWNYDYDVNIATYNYVKPE